MISQEKRHRLTINKQIAAIIIIINTFPILNVLNISFDFFPSTLTGYIH